MAQASTHKFSEFLILVGDGESPEEFDDPCGLTSRGFQRTANMNDTNIPDCDDPDAPTWLGRDVISYQATLSGAGVVASESKALWEEWWQSGASRNIRIELGDDAWEGAFKIAEFNITGERGQRVNMDISLVSDGVVAAVTP
jgi:predicted secreted protein